MDPLSLQSIVTGVKLGQDIYNNILFINAILECDTTPRLYGIGKGTSLVAVKLFIFNGQMLMASREYLTFIVDDLVSLLYLI